MANINNLSFPFEPKFILRKKKGLKRKLLERSDLLQKRIYIGGGSTTAEIVEILELFLLEAGIKPLFFEGEFNRYYEELMFPNKKLETFKPDLIFIHTSQVNIKDYPKVSDDAHLIEQKLNNEFEALKGIWDKVRETYACTIIQNNFELPFTRPLGNLDFSENAGKTNFVNQLNSRTAEYARSHSDFLIHDINYLSSWIGLEKWANQKDWYLYKYAVAFECIPHFAHSLSSIIKAVFGKSKKALALDLDNTLWGGVIGDDGLENIKIGKETAPAEAYSAFQSYLLELKDRGVILTIASKNERENALAGLKHPESILSEEDFTNIKANWEPKAQNIQAIAKEVNIYADSIVFVDDNPSEREFVRQYAPEVNVLEMSDDIVDYISLLDKSGLFEMASLSGDDLDRNKFYQVNLKREKQQSSFVDYGQYLQSLDMKAEIAPFKTIYLDRITQLTNKTNQFNLTTQRYTAADIQRIANDDNYVTIYGKMKDRFGDNGLISVIIASPSQNSLHIDLWIMSCRVFKREMELAMLDSLIAYARQKGHIKIVGTYLPTKKNILVKDLYREIGFTLTQEKGTGESTWSLDIQDKYEQKNKHIKVQYE